MLTSISLLLLIPLMSWLDRARGNPANPTPKPVALLSIGYLSSIYTGHIFDWQAIAIMLSIAVTHNIGFGEPVGHALTGVGGQIAEDGTSYETWQTTKLLKENPWIALMVRGVMVGMGTLVALDWITSLKIAVAFGVAFPLAAYIVRYWLKMGGEGWAKMEYIRGGLIGSILFLSTL